MPSVAVRVTDCPADDGFRLDAMVMEGVEAALLTVCDAEPEPVSNEASPSYTPTIVWLPAVRPAVVSDALPLDSVLLPSSVAPSKKRTVPSGAPAAGAAAPTWAVNVIG